MSSDNRLYVYRVYVAPSISNGGGGVMPDRNNAQQIGRRPYENSYKEAVQAVRDYSGFEFDLDDESTVIKSFYSTWVLHGDRIYMIDATQEHRSYKPEYS